MVSSIRLTAWRCCTIIDIRKLAQGVTEKKVKIKFYPKQDNIFGIIDQPIPAINDLPDWYKKMSSYIDKNSGPALKSGGGNLTIKKCSPFLDAVSGGYFITLPCDVIFNPKNDGYKFDYQWTGNFDAVSQHSQEQISGVPVPEGFDGTPLKWMSPWIIETPPGYSCWITHPSARNDLPFVTMTGFVDTDMHPMPTNFPFFLKNNFSGTIKMGTPIAQIIPIKRDSWKMSVENSHPEKRENFRQRLHMYAGNAYKNFVWSRKKYR